MSSSLGSVINEQRVEIQLSLPIQLRVAQTQLDQVEEASEQRVQNVVEAAIGALEAALEASEANSQTLGQHKAQLMSENASLKEQIKALITASAEQKRASDALLQAEKARGQAVATAVRAKCNQIVAQLQAAAPVPLADYVRGLSPDSAAYYATVHQKDTARINTIIATVRTLNSDV